MNGKIQNDYISNGIRLNYIANNIKEFSVPEQIRFILNNCK